MRLVVPVLLATAGAAALVALLEASGGDFGGWPTWQAIAVPAAAFAVPALLSVAVTWRHGWFQAILWAVACAAIQFALVFGVGFLALDYGPS
jgi:hypothetical protein